MSRISPTSDQLHLLDNRDDLHTHLLQMVAAGQLEVYIFSRKLNPLLFSDSALAESVSGIARSHRRARVRILVEDPKSVIETNHPLLSLYRRLPSKVSMQKITLEPQDDYEFVIVDDDKLWLQHKAEEYTGFANYDARPEAKRFMSVFDELWKNSEVDPGLRQLNL